jgi:antitoxin (DNA-binding transcriptional repressor) of toxin-antitoxin stability system
VEITDRGRPVALLTPLPGGSPLEQLRAAGDLQPAGAKLAELPPPLSPTVDELPSETLARLRRDER